LLLSFEVAAPATYGHPSARPAAPADMLTMSFVGANADPQVAGLDRQAGVSNYLIGNDPTKCHTNVPNYGQVEYHNLYHGIDLIYYGNQQQFPATHDSVASC
jgi:hypothetical protein